MILVEANAVGTQSNAEQYVRESWNIGQEDHLIPIPTCMLRGTPDLISTPSDLSSMLKVENPHGSTVELTSDNMPPHMHHSSITTGGQLPTIRGSKSTPPKSYSSRNGVSCDMFYNDSMCVGLEDNEMQGTVDRFSVEQTGEGAGETPSISHNIMPKYHEFYGFVVQKANA